VHQDRTSRAELDEVIERRLNSRRRRASAAVADGLSQ
jgi:hypothetical protein